MSSHSHSRFRLRAFGVRTHDGFETSPLSAEIDPGQTLLIVGPASSGKSIIFEHLGGYVRPAVRGVGHHDENATLVPQDSRLAALPTDNAWSILGLPRHTFLARRLFGFSSSGSPKEKRAEALLHRLGFRFSRMFDRPLSNLSSGERRSLLVVAALLGRPETLLIDGWEEYSDPVLRKHLVSVLEDERARGMKLVVSARHFPPLDLPFDRALELSGPVSTHIPALPLVPVSHDFDPTQPVLSIQSLIVERRRLGWSRSRRIAYPVDGANLLVFPGEAVCVIGPAGSGKSSLLQAIAGLLPSSYGSIRLDRREVVLARGRRGRRLRKKVQLVFHDAASVLDGARTVLSLLNEGASLGDKKNRDVTPILEKLALPKSLLTAYADELSASESQRVDLARSLAVAPKLLLWDGPEVGGADTDGGILASTLKHEKAKGRSFLLATQSPQVAEALGDRVAMMYAGRIVETGSVREILDAPAHPVTAAYLAGNGLSPSDPFAPAPGCPHVGNCARRSLPQCSENEPQLSELVPLSQNGFSGSSRRRQVACFFPLTGERLVHSEAPVPQLMDEPDSHSSTDSVPPTESM